MRGTLLGLAVLTAASETAHWVASEASEASAGGNCAVLVLGSPANADGTATEEQRLRVQAGMDAATRNRCDLVVVSGGAVRNQHREAEVMAALAQRGGTEPHLTVVSETTARNTWENIGRSLPLLEGYGRILIASDALHAQRGRRYLCKQRPALCTNAGIAAAKRPWQRIPYRVGSSLYELRAWIRDSLLY